MKETILLFVFLFSLLDVLSLDNKYDALKPFRNAEYFCG